MKGLHRLGSISKVSIQASMLVSKEVHGPATQHLSYLQNLTDMTRHRHGFLFRGCSFGAPAANG